MMHERDPENHRDANLFSQIFSWQNEARSACARLKDYVWSISPGCCRAFCTMQLGDLGAEVIKVERPGEGDDTRAFAPPYQGAEAAYFPVGQPQTKRARSI